MAQGMQLRYGSTPASSPARGFIIRSHTTHQQSRRDGGGKKSLPACLCPTGKNRRKQTN